MSQQTCIECQEDFDKNVMVEYGHQYVCSGCKDTFFQKIKEGVAPTSSMVYKGFWIRFAAVFLDGILMQIVTLILSGVLGAVIGFSMASNPEAVSVVAGLIGMVIGFLIPAAYEIIMIAKGGSTLGKMAAKIKVVREDGSPLTMGQSALRYLAKLLSGLILMIGYIMAAFDDEKRALHDRLCGTRVVAR